MTKPADRAELAEELYQPFGDECTVYQCDEEIERHVQWPNGSIVAGFCDRHADQKLSIDGAKEVQDV